MEREGYATAHRDLGHLPAIVARDTRSLLSATRRTACLARGPRFRLPAELIRDNALAVSGLLDNRIGGPSVSPYQPKGLWEEMAFGGGFSGQIYVQSTGHDLYRRSMYTIWKRTVPPPALVTFDAPDREKCTARRSRHQYPAAGAGAAERSDLRGSVALPRARMLTQGGKTSASRINFAFRLATGRLPDAQERAVLLDQAQDGAGRISPAQRRGEGAVAVGDTESDPRLNQNELAAWTTVASIILNLDETITKE